MKTCDGEADTKDKRCRLRWIFQHRPKNERVKAIPLQAWSGTEGSRSLRLPDFKTIATWRL